MGPGAGAGVVLVSPEGGKFQYAVRLHFPVSNNIAEYEALISVLRIAIDIGATRLYIYGDSDGGRSMYRPAEWGPRTRETTLLGDLATTTRLQDSAMHGKDLQ